MKRFLLLIALAGCGDSGDLAAMRAAFENAKETVVDEQKATTAKAEQAVAILKENTAALQRIETKLEASLVVPKVEPGKEVIKSAPESPAKANTQQAHPKVATPGTSQPETLVQLATRLYAQGVNTNMKTREELEAIDAQMQGVKSQPVQYQMRASFMQPSGTICVNGQCFTPQASRRRR